MRAGSIRLFKIFGITVYLHWTWFLIMLYFVQELSGFYTNKAWAILDVVALFTIVLLHEFGHALACRSVGGQADTIILWPFGGFAYVSPPWRPGAMLWSIVAGPLVNVILIPVTIGICWITLVPYIGWNWLHVNNLFTGFPDLASVGNAGRFAYSIMVTNIFILIFNLLPVYPLDGGKILWSLLWYVTGEAAALRIASVVGLLGSGALTVWAFRTGQIYLIAISIFLIFEAITAYRQSSHLIRMNKIPRHGRYHCPNCDQSPRTGAFWTCGNCGTHFDMFVSHAQCPQCGSSFMNTDIQCPECRAVSPVSAWFAAATVDPVESPQ